MRPRVTGAGLLRQCRDVALAAIASGLLATNSSARNQPTAQQLSENCTVSVLNRTVQVNANGSWLLQNVPANFGQVRARITCTIDGKTVSGESDPFLVPSNGSVEIPPITLGGTTPIPTSLSLYTVTGNEKLTGVGDTLQLVVAAHYANNYIGNVTAASWGTTYTTSNAAIVTVSADGLLTALSGGTVVIQATNDGAAGIFVAQVLVSGADTDGDGIPDAEEIRLGLNPNNPVDAFEDVDRDGLTNLQEFQQGTNFGNPDTDGDGLTDGDEVIKYNSSPLLRDTDGDGISDAIEVQNGTAPNDANSYDLSKALTGIAIAPTHFTLTFNTITGDASRLLKVTGTLVDGTSIDLTNRQRDTQFSSSDLNVCNFGSTAGQVFAGQTGTCTVSATVAGFDASATGTVHSFSPTALSFVAIPGSANNVDVNGNIAYVAAGSRRLANRRRVRPHRAAHRRVARVAGQCQRREGGWRTGVHRRGFAGLHIVDVANPLAPQLLGSVLPAR